MKFFLCLTQILIILLFQSVSAQSFRIKGEGYIAPWEFGLSAGTSLFVTSINPEPGALSKTINYWHRKLNPAIGLSVVRNISPSLGIEIDWLNTHLTGTWNNKWPAHPISENHENPLTFNSQINQFDVMMVFNMDQLMLPGDPEDSRHLFFKTGIGFSQINDTKKFYPNSQHTKLSFALGVGYSVSINEKIKLLCGSIFRIANTDNLDGVHVVYTNSNGETLETFKAFEIYNYTYFMVSYNWGRF